MSSERDARRELKTALAELTPSPWLEEAVAEIARETSAGTGERNAWRRRKVVVAAAAVLLLSVGWVAYRARQEPARTSVVVVDESAEGRAADVEDAASVWTPWSPRQVQVARKGSPLPHFGERDVDAGTWITIGSVGPGSTIGTDGPAEHPPAFNAQFQHRYAVNGAEREPYVEREVAVASLPEPGVMLGGQALLEILGDAILSGAGRTAVVHVDGKQWRSVPTRPDMELILGSPEPGGAEARVRVRLSTAYTGSLLVEEPLARALGLYQYELPGGVHVGGSLDLHATGARARVRIPELGVDTTLAVEVCPWRGWNVVEIKRSSNSKASAWVRVKGAVPDAIAHADDVRLTEDGELEVLNAPDRQGAMSLGLLRHRLASGQTSGRVEVSEVEVGMSRSGPTQLALQYDASVDQPAALLFLGSIDVLPKERWTYTYDVRWITLAQHETPGARVVVARTWRGGTAIPSKDGVAVTRVGADGRVRFPWSRGEAGDALRLRIEREEGWTVHDVRLGADAAIVAEIRADGIRVSGREHGTNLGSLREHLRSLIQVREPDGSAALTLEIRAADDTPWSAIQRVLAVFTEPGIQIHRIAYGRLDDPEAPLRTTRLKDRAPGEEAPKTLSVLVARKDVRGAPWVAAKLPSARGEVSLLPDAEAIRAFKTSVERECRAYPDLVAEIAVDDGGSTPRAPSYGDVRRVLRVLVAGGISTITFEPETHVDGSPR